MTTTCLCGNDHAPVGNVHIRRANPLRKDPTRTITLQKRFYREILRRAQLLQTAVIDFLVVRDVLGLKEESDLPFFLLNAGFQFNTNPARLEAFNTWFADQVQQNLFTVDPNAPSSRPWVSEYVISAYRQGLANAYLAAHAADLLGPGRTAASVAEFLGSFAAPVMTDQVRLLYTRAFEELRGVSASIAAAMSRILAQGFVDGSSPVEIAQRMSRTIRDISMRRGLLIARTEIVRAHAEGQLDAYQSLGIGRLGIRAEWSTAGDDRVCPLCAGNEGEVFTLKKARGLIPLHPQCRCVWLPLV